MTLEAALEYGALGLRIFPVGPDKRPLVREWPTVASADTDQIVKWWDGTFPDAGIGLATGDRLAESRYLFVVDLDRHDPAADGIEAWLDLVDANDRDVVEGPRALTPSGGQHLYFTAPYPLTNARGTLPAGIDVRGRGGYVVLPESVTSGGRYDWDAYAALGDVKIPEAPEWLLDVLKTKPEPDKPSPSPTPTSDVWAALDDRPGTLWHNETEWKTLLEADGWIYLRTQPDGTQEWQRPGQEERGKTGATVNYGGADRLVVHSTNANVPPDSYSKLGYYAAAHFGGDFAAATKAIIAEQDPRPSSTSPNPSDTGSNTTPEAPDADDDWTPIDVVNIARRIVSGDYQPEEPLYLKVRDALPLIYAGRSHVVFGSPGGGKTWIALAAVAERLIAGDDVLMLDWEDSASGTVDRLLRLGVTVEQIARFDYRSVVTSLAYGWSVLDSTTTPYTLVVIDSTGEALAAQGVNPNDDGEVAVWMSLVKRLSLREGSPAVLLLDHVPKSTENPHGAPIGSQRKLAAVTGAAYRCDTTIEPARGKAGKLKLTVAKDRLGHRAKGTVAAEVNVADTDTGIDVTFSVTEAQAAVARGERFFPTVLMERVSKYVEENPGATKKEIEQNVEGKAASVRQGLEALVDLGFLRQTDAGRGIGFLHYSEHSYREGDSLNAHDPGQIGTENDVRPVDNYPEGGFETGPSSPSSPVVPPSSPGEGTTPSYPPSSPSSPSSPRINTRDEGTTEDEGRAPSESPTVVPPGDTHPDPVDNNEGSSRPCPL